MTRMRKTRTVTLGLLLVGLGFLLAQGDRQSGGMDESERRVDCEVTLELDGWDDVYVAWHTTDPALIEELVQTPLDEAVVERHPADYETYGHIRLTDGETVRFIQAWNPWGHIKEGHTYRIADLRKLLARIEQDMAAELEEIKGYRIAGQTEHDGAEPRPTPARRRRRHEP